MSNHLQDMANKINTAIGKQKADLVLQNANVVDVFCHKIRTYDVAITDGVIVGLGKYEGKQTIDCTGKYVMPSFFDTHVHFESSMVTPDKYLATVAPKGVTCLNADCHEIANVCGEAGIQYMIDCTSNIPVDVHFMLPSCVPATPFEHCNANITAKDTQRLMQSGKFFGLGEMMNYPGVINADKEVLGKLSTTSIIDGHAPTLTDKQLNAYLCGNILTDHESETIEEVEEKIAKGMYVLIREGSQTKNLSTLIKSINPQTKRRMAFCTDDRYIGEIMSNGSIQNCIVKAVENGVDPFDAIEIASFNAYQCYGIRNKGAVAINYSADLVIADDLVPRNIICVLKDGKLIAKDGKALFDTPYTDDSKVTNTVNIKPVSPKDFELDFVPNKTVVMQILKDTVVTKKVTCDSNKGLNMLAVIERHKATGNIGKCWVKDFNLRHGAIAQTVGHDSHNVTVIGDNTSDMALAVNALGKAGGMVLVVDGKVEYNYTLDIAGLMSSKPVEEVIKEHIELENRTKVLGINDKIAPYMLMSFLSLIVIPEVKLCDSGLFDVTTFQFIEQ